MSLPDWTDIASLDECWARSGRVLPDRPATFPAGQKYPPRGPHVEIPFFRRLGVHEMAFVRMGYERFVSSSATLENHPAWRVYPQDDWLHFLRGEHWSFSIQLQVGPAGGAMVYGIAPRDGGLHDFARDAGGLTAAAKWVMGFTLYGKSGDEWDCHAPPVARAVCVANVAGALGDVALEGPVAWGAQVSSSNPGIYFVEVREAREEPLLDEAQLEAWHRNWHGKQRPASADALRELLMARWQPHSRVVYIGQTAGSLQSRVGQFYKHKLGDTSPKAGGQSVLTLGVATNRRVYWIESDSPKTLEHWALRAHADLLRARSAEERELRQLLPFANRRY